MDSSVTKEKLPSLKPLRDFVSGKWFDLIVFLLAGTVYICSFFEYNVVIPGLIAFCFLISFLLIVCEDLMTTTLPFLLLAMMLIKCYDSYSTFIGYVWLAIPVVGSLLFHFIFYRQKLKMGKCFWAIFAASVATTIGGIGYLPWQNFISLTGFYYIFGCGFGMLLVYVLLSSYLKATDEYSLSDKLTRIMVIVGLFGVFMIVTYYLYNLDTVFAKRGIIYMQMRNNLSTFFMFSMPFAFYKTAKNPYYSFLGLLFFFCILLTGSRGGLIFGGIEFFICVAFVVGIDKKHRIPYLSIIIVILTVSMFFVQDFYHFFGHTFDRVISLIMGLHGNEQEIRVRLFKRAIIDFKSSPIFGTGLTNPMNRDIHHSTKFALCWYHCEPLQIIGSFGIIGVLGYGYQFIKRLKIILKRTTIFNITIFVSYIAVELMSLVNPGVFCPVPYLFLVTMFIVIVEKCNEKGENEEIEIYHKKRRIK